MDLRFFFSALGKNGAGGACPFQTAFEENFILDRCLTLRALFLW